MRDEFARIWKFVGISNQALAAITCWTIAMYLALKGKNHLMMSLPAFFLVSSLYHIYTCGTSFRRRAGPAASGSLFITVWQVHVSAYYLPFSSE